MFGPDSLRTNPEVGLRLVRGVLSSEVKSFLELNRDAEAIIKSLNDIHQMASRHVKISSPPSRSPASHSPAEPSSPAHVTPVAAAKRKPADQAAFQTPLFPVKTPSATLRAIPESAELSSTRGSSSKVPLSALEVPSPAPASMASPSTPVMDYTASTPIAKSPPRPEVSPNSKQRRAPPPEAVEDTSAAAQATKDSTTAPPVFPPAAPGKLSPGKLVAPPTPPTEPNTTSSRPASPSSQSLPDKERKSIYSLRLRSGKSDASLESAESGSSASSARRSGISTENMTAEEKEEYLRKKKERQNQLVNDALAAAEKEREKNKGKEPDAPPVGRVRSLTSVEGEPPRPSLSIQTDRRPSITGNRNSLRHTGGGTVAAASANITTRQSLGIGPGLMSPALTNRQSLRLNSTGATITPAKKRYSYTGVIVSAADVMAGSALDGVGRRSEMGAPITPSTKTVSMAGADESDANDLPPGWKEHFDPATKRPFYVHKPTKARQWKRPTHANPEPSAKKVPPVRRMSSKSETSEDSSVADRFSAMSATDRSSMTDRFSVTDRKLTQFDAEPDQQTIMNMLTADLGAQLHVAERGSMTGGNLPLRASLARPKAEQREVDPEWVAQTRQMNLEAGAQNSCLTVTKMEYLGSVNKSGYLMKKSSILGRWRKRWFVLDGNRFEYFERPQDEASGAGKAFMLSPLSLTAYTTTPQCFCVKASEESDEGSHWYLTAKDDADMEGWIMAINSRIHVMYAQEYGWNTRDLWEEGFVETTFWRVLKPSSATQAGVVSVRTLPKTNAPRTGETHTAGEVLECVQTIRADFNTYLRLWGDRGWIYEKHSKARYAVLGQVLGTFTECTREYRYLGKGNLPILSGPGKDNTVLVVDSKSVILANSVFTVCAKFIERLADGTESDFTFYKLATGRGWICGQDKSGEAQIQWIV